MVPGSGVLTSPVVKTSEPSGLTSTDVAKLSQGAPWWKEPSSHSCAPVAASYATVLNAAAPEKPDASPAPNTFDPAGVARGVNQPAGSKVFGAGDASGWLTPRA